MQLAPEAVEVVGWGRRVDDLPVVLLNGPNLTLEGVEAARNLVRIFIAVLQESLDAARRVFGPGALMHDGRGSTREYSAIVMGVNIKFKSKGKHFS